MDTHTAPGPPAPAPASDAECANGRLTDATTAPTALSGSPAAVAIAAGYGIDGCAIEGAEASPPPAHRISPEPTTTT